MGHDKGPRPFPPAYGCGGNVSVGLDVTSPPSPQVVPVSGDGPQGTIGLNHCDAGWKITFYDLKSETVTWLPHSKL